MAERAEELKERELKELETVCEREPQTTRKELLVDKYGLVVVHVQGELVQDSHKAVFLTVHDIGANHSAMKDFVDSEPMTEIRNRSVFIHLDVLGQQDGATDLEEEQPFPTIIREEVIPRVLDALHVSLVVGIGEGAGANILARFGLKWPARVLGLVLVNLVSTEVGFLESLKEKMFHRRNSQQMSAIDIVQLHKIGEKSSEEPDSACSALIDAYKKRVQTLNARNVKKYAHAYASRKEISSLAELDVLLITGQRSVFCAGVEAIYSKCNKTKTSLLKVTETVDPISEAPDKVAHALLLFVKGLGFLTSCPQTDGGRGSDAGLKTLGSIGRRRTLSMEEYDIPRMRRLSLTK